MDASVTRFGPGLHRSGVVDKHSNCITPATMSYGAIKSAARKLGMYRQVRWVNRHMLNRAELHQFRDERQLYREFVRPGSLCFDVGANYGFKTEVFLSLGARVIAFEPQPDCVAELRERNPSAVAICSALGSSIGSATMYVDAHRTGSSLRSDWRDSSHPHVIEVPVTTLDAAAARYGVPDFCKIDVEGFELEVLGGLSQPIPVLSFEFTARRVGDAVKCLDRLEQFGPVAVNVTPLDAPSYLFADWVTAKRARAFLLEQVPDTRGLEWGDVFVRHAVADGFEPRSLAR